MSITNSVYTPQEGSEVSTNSGSDLELTFKQMFLLTILANSPKEFTSIADVLTELDFDWTRQEWMSAIETLHGCGLIQRTVHSTKLFRLSIAGELVIRAIFDKHNPQSVKKERKRCR